MASSNPTSTSSSSLNSSFSHRRRRSSAATPQNLNVYDANNNPPRSGSSTLAPIPGRYSQAQPLKRNKSDTTVAGTPNVAMSLSRSPSPNQDGGWSSPGLTASYGDTSGRSTPANISNGANGQSWNGQRNKSGANGYPAFATQINQGFFRKHCRNISNSLPSFSRSAEEEKIGFKKKPGKNRQCLPSRSGKIGRRLHSAADFVWRNKAWALALLSVFLLWILYCTTRKPYTKLLLWFLS